MTAKFVYENDYAEILEFFHSPEDARHGIPYNTTFRLAVHSGAFMGEGVWECDIRRFRAFLKELEMLYAFQAESAQLDDIGYGSYLRFLMHPTGQMEVSGMLYGGAKEEALKFRFYADQTSLHPFIKALAALPGV